MRLLKRGSLVLGGCYSLRAPANQSCGPVPTVVGKGTPKQAALILHQAGFEVEFERPPVYCIPDDPLCSGPLDDEALEKLSVETQHGTQGEKRPAGSTITLILGSPVERTRSH